MPLIPNVYEKKNGQIMVFDLDSRLLQDRIVWIEGEVNALMASAIKRQLLYLDNISHEPITMYIDSPGGSVTDGLSILDFMNQIQSPVATIASGMACSMGATLLACGTKGMRSAMPHTTIMIHQLSTGMQGKLEDIRIACEQYEKDDAMLCSLMAEATGKDPDWIRTYWREDRYLTPQEAVEFGLIDNVLVPPTKSGCSGKRTPV